MKVNGKKIGSVILMYFIICTMLLCTYLADLIVCSKISSNTIRGNIIDAYEVLNTEGLYPSAYGLSFGFYDNWTDAYLLNIMWNQDAEHPLVSGIANYYVVEGNDVTVIDALHNAISGGGY